MSEASANGSKWDRLKIWADMATAGLSQDQRWALKQALAGEQGQFYGDGGTIHASTNLDVEMHAGRVVSVWFRCLPLAYKVHERDADRAASMDRMYEGDGGAQLSGVEWQKPAEVPAPA